MGPMVPVNLVMTDDGILGTGKCCDDQKIILVNQMMTDDKCDKTVVVEPLMTDDYRSGHASTVSPIDQVLHSWETPITRQPRASLPPRCHQICLGG